MAATPSNAAHHAPDMPLVGGARCRALLCTSPPTSCPTSPNILLQAASTKRTRCSAPAILALSDDEHAADDGHVSLSFVLAASVGPAGCPRGLTPPPLTTHGVQRSTRS